MRTTKTNWCRECRFGVAPKGCDVCDKCAVAFAQRVLGVTITITPQPDKPKKKPPIDTEPTLF